MRKDSGFEVMDHIRVTVNGNPRIAEIVENNRAAISEKVLADEITADAALAVSREWNVNGEKVVIGIEKI
jgi:isoleucyl-tRNA synthetase